MSLNSPGAAVSNQSVLLVDDDPFSLEVARIAFESLGITTIETAADGNAGLRSFDTMQPKPDLVVCDLYMPDLDGIEFINSLGARKFRGGIILVSGGDLTMMQIAQQVAKNGHGLQVLGAFPKPLLADALAQALGMSVR